MALKYHPDKQTQEDEESKEMFQKVLTAYGILKDVEKRKIYDKTGDIEDAEASSIEQYVVAYQYFRAKFPEINFKQIETFELHYVNSEQEKEDLLKFFVGQKGNVTQILNSIPLCKNEDLPRFLKFFENQINKDSKLKQFEKKFKKTKKTVKNLKNNEAKEAEKIKKSFETSLKLKMMNNRAGRRDNFAQLLEKYTSAEKPVRVKKKKVIKDVKMKDNIKKRKKTTDLTDKARPKISKKIKKVLND